MSNVSEKESKIRYFASVTYTPDRIKQVTKTQYNTFRFGDKLVQFLVAAIFLVPGIIYIDYPLGLATLAIGCIVFVTMDYAPKSEARKLIKQYKGTAPHARYYFSDMGVKTNHMKSPAPYAGLVRLVEDKTCLFLFENERTVYALEAGTIKGSGEKNGLKEYLTKRTGLQWERVNSLARLNTRVLVNELKDKFG